MNHDMINPQSTSPNNGELDTFINRSQQYMHSNGPASTVSYVNQSVLLTMSNNNSTTATSHELSEPVW